MKTRTSKKRQVNSQSINVPPNLGIEAFFAEMEIEKQMKESKNLNMVAK
jgi:hypothetical protein